MNEIIEQQQDEVAEQQIAEKSQDKNADIKDFLDHFGIKKYKLCTSFLSHLFGMMFVKNPDAYIFVFKKPQKVPIHTHFVSTKVQCLFLDEDCSIIVSVVLDKNKRFVCEAPVKYLIELPMN